ncbi:hypothetical protein Gpo141_00003042 [Globisporangium polare]
MVTLKKLLGSRSEVHYECMYTKQKTQKRKTWHDGFVALTASRKLVLFEDMPPDGKVIDEAKMTPYDWDRKDEEFINVPKFLVEIINETPINIQGDGSGGGGSYPAYNKPAKAESVADDPLPRTMNSKFKVPVSSDSTPPPRLGTRPGGGGRQPFARPGAGVPRPQQSGDMIDFDRNPTSEWSYEPNAISRSAVEVAALFHKQG